MDGYDMPNNHWNVIPMAYRRLRGMTNNFSEDNYIGDFQFGKVYRGKNTFLNKEPIYFLVKIWGEPGKFTLQPGEDELRLMDEIVFLRHERMIKHPGMVKLHGYCLDSGQIGAVYHIKPLDTVYNLVPKDVFTWSQRIKVALGLARLLKFLHAGHSFFKPFLVRNISASHIILDEEFHPKLFDFGMTSGGIFPDRTIYPIDGCYDVVDPALHLTGTWSEKNDIYSYGIVLLSLITKKLFTKGTKGNGEQDSALHHNCTLRQCNSCMSDNMVEQSLTADPYYSSHDGHKITTLAMSCVSMSLHDRPTMKQVVKDLHKLQVVKHQADFMASSVNIPAITRY